MTLTNRERYVRLFHGQPVERVPFWDIMGMWPSAIARWKTEGLAQDATVGTIRQLIGFDGHRGYQLPVKAFVWPEFERRLVEQQGDHLIVHNRWGAIEQTCVGSEVMPLTLQGAVHDRASWRAIKPLLDPATPGRLPANWNAICQEARDSQEPVYAGDLPVGFFGGPRELLGFERLVTLFYDDPALLEEILDTLCDLWVGLYTRVQQDIALDWFMVWEDMCYKKGPLISPKLFRRYLLPRYQRLTAALRAGGCAHIMVDSDGDERPLVDLWLEGGVTITFPWESQFGLDVTAVRRQWPQMGIIGGLNKYALAQGRQAMDEELAKVPWLLEQGRYLPGLDHGVPTDVSWDDYRYFFDRLRTLIYRYPPTPD